MRSVSWMPTATCWPRLRRSRCLRPREDSMGTSDVCWVSLDPVNPQICPYPPPFNRQLEDAFQASVGVEAPSLKCALGPDFFNSTVHFQTEGEKRGAHFQTTPSVNYGPRGGTKPAGYRDVRRLELAPRQTMVTLKASTHNKLPNGEWRIISGPDECMKHLEFQLPDNCILRRDAASPAAPSAELVPIWQWCLDTSGPNLSAAPDDRWAPYLEEVSADIERAYQANQPSFEVELGVRKAIVKFSDENRIFGLQVDEQYNKQRHVRRKMLPANARHDMMHPVAAAAGDEAMCAICLSQFRHTATWPVCTLGCLHVFHGCCVQVMRERNAKCPLCRSAVDWASIAETPWQPAPPNIIPPPTTHNDTLASG